LLYYLLLLSLFSLGALALRLKIKKSPLTQAAIDRIHRTVHELICEEAWERAYRELKVLIEEGDDGVETLLLQIQLLRKLQQIPQATAIAIEALGRFPHLLTLKRELGKLYLAQNQIREATFWLRQSAVILRSEEDSLEYAIALFASGAQYEAFKVIDCFLETSQSGQLLSLAADYFYFIGQYERASFFYERAIHLGWSNRNLMLRFGLSFYSLKKLRQAELIFRSLLEKDSADVFATIALGQCFMQKGLYERALLIYQSGDAWDLEDSQLLSQAGIAAISAGNHPFGEKCLRKALQKKEGSLKEISYFARSLISQKKWLEGEEAYLYLIRKFPEQSAGYRGISWLFSQDKTSLISKEQGLLIARKSVMIYSDKLAWEILNTCERKAGQESDHLNRIPRELGDKKEEHSLSLSGLVA
jgi:tetratricopeptide (TPR) repeat protein